MSALEELAAATRTVTAASGPAVVSIGGDARGSGFVVAPGKVVTNAHNLRDRTTSVRFADGRVVQAEVSGSDVDGDLVVLDVDTAGVDALEWAVGETRMGDVVFGVQRDHDAVAVTSGQISAVDRVFSGPRGRKISGGVEHTAPLRRGSSGGPLVDAAGHVVGINTHRVDPGFYIARACDNTLRDLIGRLVTGESVRRRQIGVAVVGPDVASRLRRAVGLTDVEGLLVREVEPDGPAAAAGVLIGDVLVSADGSSLTGLQSLADAVAVAGETVALHIVRGVDELDLVVTLTTAGAE
jgi:serine protease Do